MTHSYSRLLLLCLLASPLLARAQTSGSVGIGTTTPDPKAALDIRSSDKGLLIPRLDSAQRAGISAPPDGLMVFQTDGRQGFWYALGGQWLYIPDKTKASDNLGNHAATQNLNLHSYDLRLRGTADPDHGLGWYGAGSSAKNWLGQTVDGPVLYGYEGGVLGTNMAGTRLSVLAWRNNGRVGIGTNDPQQATPKQVAAVEAKARQVLAVRAQYPTESLATLYDPLTRPPALVKAHQELDRAVDLCYRPAAFATELSRLEFLFEQYRQLAAPLAPAAKPAKAGPRPKAPASH